MPTVEAARPRKSPSRLFMCAMSVTVADGSNAGSRTLEMPVGAVHSSGDAARETGRDAECVRSAVRVNVQASEESVADRSPLSVSQGWIQAGIARLEASDADRASPGTSTGGVPGEDRPRAVGT